MNVTLLDKSLSLPFFFLEQLCVCTSLHIENTNYMLQIGFLYTPNQAQWKKKGGGSITKLWHLGHQESTLKDCF